MILFVFKQYKYNKSYYNTKFDNDATMNIHFYLDRENAISDQLV